MSLRMKLTNNKNSLRRFDVADYYFDGFDHFHALLFLIYFISFHNFVCVEKRFGIDKACILKDIFRDKDRKNSKLALTLA